ncbi:transposase family protein [Streptomyces sp. URMC 129]|uniref:transposase family protein n=1 Tax=Streptomyces sp. URMC 129 TaxID=3423407 RepID=UPI003F193E15
MAILDAKEIRVRRPVTGSVDRDRFTSGKSRQNAVKAMVVTDAEGRLLFCGEVRPGSCPDITQARDSGLVDILAQGPVWRFSPMPATRASAHRPRGRS